jgi:hypothetical protein
MNSGAEDSIVEGAPAGIAPTHPGPAGAPSATELEWREISADERGCRRLEHPRLGVIAVQISETSWHLYTLTFGANAGPSLVAELDSVIAVRTALAPKSKP